jgi:hypothetical protein
MPSGLVEKVLRPTLGKLKVADVTAGDVSSIPWRPITDAIPSQPCFGWSVESVQPR